VRTTISLVDIDDCARGHLLAADEGVGGERYLLSGAAVSVEEGLAMLSRITGVTLTPTFINARLLSGLATVPEIVYGWLGRQPPLCRESVRVMTHGHSYDGSRATRDLGLIYTPLEQTIERTVAWFRSQGMIRSASSEK
jgi:dihydroflavonol-4-reductase